MKNILNFFSSLFSFYKTFSASYFKGKAKQEKKANERLFLFIIFHIIKGQTEIVRFVDNKMSQIWKKKRKRRNKMTSLNFSEFSRLSDELINSQLCDRAWANVKITKIPNWVIHQSKCSWIRHQFPTKASFFPYLMLPNIDDGEH